MKKRSMFLTLILLFPLLLVSCFDSGSDKKDSGETISKETVDTLFDSMVVQLERFYNADSADDITAEDFSKMASSFKTVYNSDPTNMKAGVGYVVASVANLNKNQKLKEIADSMDNYINAMWDYWDEEESIDERKNTFARAYQKGGVDGLSMALLANTPKMMRANSGIPSFPKMVTVGKIQSLIESEIMPVLNEVITVVENMESNTSNELTLVFDGDTIEIDLGEVYLADASLRLLRHTLYFFTAYNYDVKSTDGQDIHAVIDSFVKLEDEVTSGSEADYIYSLSADGDTLFREWRNFDESDDKFLAYIYDLIDYNMKRSDFLGLQRNNHDKMYSDIKMVPTKIKKAIEFISNESKDDQENDLIKIADIDSMTADMVDLAEDMELEGISAVMAANFKSPTALADYLLKILSGPENFNETINGVTFNYTIDFSKFYTNPVNNFKDWLPKYKMSGKDNYTYIDTSEGWISNTSSQSIYINYNDSVAIDPSFIESNDGSVVKLKKAYSVKVERELYQEFMPFILVDDNNNAIASTFDEIEDALFDEAKFPYFSDYTFNGIFSGMTRAKWYELFQKMDEAFAEDDVIDGSDSGR